MATKGLKLTQEMKSKLMGYSAATGSLDFIPDMDVPKEYQLTLTVRNINNKEYNKIKQLQHIKDENKVEKEMLDIVRGCFSGWNQFIDISKDYVEYIEYETNDDGIIRQELFDLLPLKMKLALFTFIMKINGIGA